jgi:DNA polymerase-1
MQDRRNIVEPRWGSGDQTAGGVWVINSKEQIRLLLERLDDSALTGLDTEFEGVDKLKDESPVGKATIVSWSVAYCDPSLGKHKTTGVTLAQRCWIPNFGRALEEGWLHEFAPWLESADHPKVGSFFMSIDMHAFRNHGIVVGGVQRDQVRQSQQWRNGKTWRHGLKETTSDLLGYEMRDFNQVFGIPLMTVATRNKPAREYKDGRVQIQKLSYVASHADESLHKPRLGVNETLAKMLLDWVDYGSLDAKASLETSLVLDQKLDEMQWRNGKTMLDFYKERWSPYQYVVWGMENEGWPADEEWFRTQSSRCNKDVTDLDAKLNRWAGATVNWNSYPQMKHLLYGEGAHTFNAGQKGKEVTIIGKGLPLSPVSKHGPTEDQRTGEIDESCDSVALEYVRAHCRKAADKEAIGWLMYRTKCTTIRKFYLSKMPLWIRANGRIYSRIGTETETGRLSSKHPPLNVLPRPGWSEKKPWEGDPYDVREGLTCEPGWCLVSLDYSQLEMRILAHYLILLFTKEDPERCWDLANDLAAGDLHGNTAIRVWGSHPLLNGLTAQEIKDHVDARVKAFRNRGKIVNFSVNYGKTAIGLGADIRDDEDEPIGKEAAQQILNQYFDGYPTILKYHRWAGRYAMHYGYIRTLEGRYRYLPGAQSGIPRLVSAAKRQAMNTPIQGSAADIIMMAMLYANTLPVPDLRRLGYFDEELYDLKARLIMQVHDELVFTCPIKNADAVAKKATWHMERPFRTDSKIEVVSGFPVSGLPLPVERGGGKKFKDEQELQRLMKMYPHASAIGKTFYPPTFTYRETK